MPYMQLTTALFLNPLEVIYWMICCLLTNAYDIAQRQNVVNLVHFVYFEWLNKCMCVWLNISPLLLIAWKVNAFSFNIFAIWNPKEKKLYIYIKKSNLLLLLFFFYFKSISHIKSSIHNKKKTTTTKKRP